MSQLRDQVVNYIKELGDEAPKFFGVPASTIKAWLKTGRIPGAAYDKVFDAQTEPPTEESFASEEDALAAAPEATSFSSASTAWQAEVERVINEMNVSLASAHARISFLEGNGSANAPTFVPPPAQRGQGIQVIQPNPRESNVRSMVRPAGAVTGMIKSQPTVVQAPHESTKPLPSWLKPRPIKRS